MRSSTRIARIVRFMREHPRHVATCAGALAAMLVAAWWLSSPRASHESSRVAQGAALTRTYGPSLPSAAPFRALEPSPTSKNGELCGYGPVPVIDGYPQIPPEVESAPQSALATLAAALKASPTDADRAMGTYLEMLAAGGAASSDWYRTHGDCTGDDIACQSAEAQVVATARAETLGALVRLASTTTDPDAYALAVYACPPVDDSSNPHCGLLNYAQWARIEPDNAVPWLYLAREAERRHDPSGFEAALERASKSGYSDPHWDQVQKLFAWAPVGAESSPVQVQLAVVFLGIHAAFPFPGPLSLTQYCGKADQTNLRIETCTSLAAMLIGHGRTALEVLFGHGIAEAIGWNDRHLAALRDQADAIKWQWSQHFRSAVEQAQTSFSCDGLQRLRRNAAAEAQLGETGLLRRELADAGISISQAAERLRAEVRQQSLKAK